MTNRLYTLRTCQTWCGHTAASIVASIRPVRCRAGNVSSMCDLIGLQSHQFVLSDENSLVVADVGGADCQMLLDNAEIERMRDLEQQTEDQMRQDIPQHLHYLI